MTRDGIAWRIAQDLDEGSYVNLGVGIPVLVANYLDRNKEIFLHSENGILGVGPPPVRDEIDFDLISAGKGFCTLAIGAALFDQQVSFAMMTALDIFTMFKLLKLPMKECQVLKVPWM